MAFQKMEKHTRAGIGRCETPILISRGSSGSRPGQTQINMRLKAEVLRSIGVGKGDYVDVLSDPGTRRIRIVKSARENNGWKLSGSKSSVTISWSEREHYIGLEEGAKRMELSDYEHYADYIEFYCPAGITFPGAC